MHSSAPSASLQRRAGAGAPIRIVGSISGLLRSGSRGCRRTEPRNGEGHGRPARRRREQLPVVRSPPGPALPFACLAIPPIWRRAGPLLRLLIVALTCVGVGESLIAVTTPPQPPSDIRRPMAELLWPMFRDGDFPLSWQSVLDLWPPAGPMSQLVRDGVPRESWNLGQLVGLQGHASLIPLGIVWAVAAVAWPRIGSGGSFSSRRES